jgi:putative hydrolase of HD superfamily
MAVFSFLFSEDKGVKIKDAVSQCVVHDIAESLVGDITHKDKIPRTEKYERERRTVAFLQSLIPQDSPLESSWDDFETGKTFTGVVAKQLDQLDLGFQALIYELKLGKRLDEFFKSAERAHLCSELIEEIVNTREIGGSGALDPDALESLNNYYGLQIQ